VPHSVTIGFAISFIYTGVTTSIAIKDEVSVTMNSTNYFNNYSAMTLCY